MNNRALKIALLAVTIFFIQKSEAQLLKDVLQAGTDTMSLRVFVQNNPGLVRSLLNEINLSYPGLEKTKSAVENNDWLNAATGLLSYYRNKEQFKWLQECSPAITDSIMHEADESLRNTYTFQTVRSALPVTKEGGRDWYYKGPENDIEWAYFLNRTMYFNSLRLAYCHTQKTGYAGAFNSLVSDWMLSNPTPAVKIDNATWRPLETGLRLALSWPMVFYQFQGAPQFTDVTRLLMLCSIIDQSAYTRKYHWVHHNHGVMELNGLTTAALLFPELKQSPEWYSHALVAMEEEFKYQNYPDGAMKELTNSYHIVVAENFFDFIDLHHKTATKLPAVFNRVLESMYNYMVYTSRPDGYGLLNNDADLKNNFNFVKPFVQVYNRPDWNYVLSNGRLGVAPKNTSIMFPWAGQFIMRNGYGERNTKDHFASFDVGPWGTSHQHNDQLNFTLYAGGRELLCDAGRMYYKTDQWRHHFNASSSHNVLAINGRGENRQQTESVAHPYSDSLYSIQPGLDFCIGSFTDGYGDKGVKGRPAGYKDTVENIPAIHTRAVVYIKDKYWLVFDYMETKEKGTITANWHFAPDCTVSVHRQAVATDDKGKGNLSVIPLSGRQWDVSVIKGRQFPSIQGWYSEKYNSRVPAPTASFTSVLNGTPAKEVWMMVPENWEIGKKVTSQVLPAPEGAIRLSINMADEPPVEIAVNMKHIQPIQMSGGVSFTGRCIVLQKGKMPILVNGSIKK